MTTDQILRRLAAAMDAVDDHSDPDLNASLNVVAAIFGHLLDNPDLAPAEGRRPAADVIVPALKHAWPKEEWGADWIADTLDRASPDAAEHWRKLG